MKNKILIVMTLSLIISSCSKLVKEEESNKKSNSQQKLQYVNAVITDKIVDAGRPNARILVYRDGQNNAFFISDVKLWRLPQVNDSVKIGFTQDTTSILKSIKYISIEILGKANDTTKQYRVEVGR